MSNPTDCGDAHAAAHPDDGDGEIDWQRLYEMHAPLVRRHAAKFVDASLVDDIVQETFLRAYRNRHSIRPDRPLGPWLTVIARRAAIDVVRRQQVHDRVSSELPRPLPAPEPIEDDYFNAVRRAGIRHVFGDLNERHRRVLARSVLQTGPGEERAALDDSTRSTLARARGRFRERYLELSRQTGVFGGAVAAVRRRSASVRDSLVRVEAWVQSGMPVLIAACASVSLLGTGMHSGEASGALPQESLGRDRTAELPGSTITLSTRPAVGVTVGFGSLTVGNLHDGPAASPDPRRQPNGEISTTVDWTVQRGGPTSGIYIETRTHGPDGERRTFGHLTLDCTSREILPRIRCAAWDQVPEDRRQHEVGVPDATAGAGLSR